MYFVWSTCIGHSRQIIYYKTCVQIYVRIIVHLYFSNRGSYQLLLRHRMVLSKDFVSYFQVHFDLRNHSIVRTYRLHQARKKLCSPYIERRIGFAKHLCYNKYVPIQWFKFCFSHLLQWKHTYKIYQRISNKFDFYLVWRSGNF